MQRSRSESMEFWHNHIIQSKLQSGSISSYCKANDLQETSFYYWKHKFSGPKSKKLFSKKLKTPFSPVVVSPEVKVQSYPHQDINRGLPDSRWVSEIITNVIRGLL